MIRRVFSSLIVVSLLVQVSWSAIIYTDVTDKHVIGSWRFADGDAVLVTPTDLSIDLNHDGTPDTSIAHHYIRGVNRIPRESVELLQTANQGQRAALSLLKNIRSLTLDAANEGVNDADAFYLLQAQVDNSLDTLRRIAINTQYNGQRLLEGSAGMTGTASDSNVRVLNVADTVQPGTYSFTVDTAAARATFLTPNALVNPLSQDETLTLNGVRVELSAGLTATQVQDRINQFTDQTHVTARVVLAGADAEKLRLSGVNFGVASNLDAISNVAGAAADSTTIGTTLTQGIGVDIVATIGGMQFNGQGNTVTADSDIARGLTLSVAPMDSWDNHHVTFAGQLGVVTVSDQSLSFPLNPSQGETAGISIRTLHPGSLGLQVLGNQFANLEEIDVTSASRAQDALGIVDSAVDTVRTQIQQVESMLDNYFLPFGEAVAEGLGLAEVAIHEGEIDLLTTGESIGPESRFTDEPLAIGSLEFDGRDSAFLGVRVMENDRFHYGWIRADIANDESLIIRDFAFESLPDRHIRAGFVPEPTSAVLAFTGLAMAAFWKRQNRHQQ